MRTQTILVAFYSLSHSTRYRLDPTWDLILVMAVTIYPGVAT
jgi:hypothetical protein